MTADNFRFKSIKEQLNKKETKTAILIDAVFLWIYLTGTFGWFASVFQVTVFWPIVLIGLVFAASGISIFSYSEKKIRTVAGLIWVILLLFFAAIGHPVLKSGMNQMLNQAIDVIGKQFPYMWPTYTVTVEAEYIVSAVSLTVIFMSGIWGFVGMYLLKSGNRMLPGLHLGIIFFAQIIGRLSPSVFWNIMVIISFMAIWFRSRAEKLPAGSQRFASMGSLLFLSVCIFALFGLMQIFLPVDTYVKPEAIENWKEGAADEIRARRYQGDSRILPEGRFEHIGSFQPTDKTVLKVTMTKPESYYLRGFVGSIYTGTGWEETNEESRWEYHDLFYWLHDSGYYGQETLSLAALALGEENQEEIKKEGINTITIHNISGNSAYCYVPYELNSTLVQNGLPYDSQKIGDENLMAEGKKGSRTYAYAALSNQITKYASYAAKLLNPKELSESAKQYQKLESYYNEFVYDTYLNIPINLRSQLKKIAGTVQIDAGEKHAEYAEAKQNIIYILSSECMYQEELKETWSGADFVADFLTRTKEGYSIHFASAATMLFRYYGIPARYVEGYLVTPQDVEEMTAEEAYAIDENHAHAWVEYYQDGVGWLPFETTPSYLNVMPKAEEYQDISGTASSSGSKQTIENEELEDEEEVKRTFDWMLFLEVVLLIGIVIVVMVFLSLLIYVIMLRQRSKKIKKLFTSDDTKEAVRSIFSYTMNILAVAGLRIKNTSLYRYGTPIEHMFDEEIRKRYEEAVTIRQEAVYSNHEVTEEQRKILLEFKDIIWQRVYKGAGFVQKFQLKYIYFL